METRVDEIAPQIFRIAVWTGKAAITFNQFVIRDAHPTLVHTGHAALFDIVRPQVERLLDPRTLRYISFSHFEADECGALNHWLALAPQAEVLCGTVAARTSIGDFSLRPPRAVVDGGTVELGQHSLQVLETPHFPHNWDAILLYESHSGTLFGSDLGTHGGQREAMTEEDRSEEILALQRRLGYIPAGPHVSAALARLRQLPITCLATMHGSALRGPGIHTLCEALEHACGGIQGDS
ncbi:MAG TPA: MBL fold metallo-hydrolase [Candidatus Tectomicrobia bacterium]|jgi:flavorubredoxin